MVCTDAFERMGRATAAVAGLPNYPFALITHPIGRISPEELRARAEAALPQVLTLLAPPRGA